MPCEDFVKVTETDDKKSITFTLKDMDTTLINPIMDTLDRDENVKIVRFVNIHPELENPELIVEVRDNSDVTAKEAVIIAANAVSEYFGTVNTSDLSK